MYQLKILTLCISITLSNVVFALLTKGNAPPLPEFSQQQTTDWLNSPPLKKSDLTNHVLLLDIWTYGCHNCLNSIPWLKTIENRFHSDGLKVIGVHSPEFPHEKDRTRVLEKVREFGLNHPIMIDNDLRFWRAIKNRAWPAFFLIDKQGHIRGAYLGEIRINDKRARRIESEIELLLQE